MNLRSILSAAGVLGAAFGAQALSITSLTPQGEVAQVRQVVAKFDGSAVNFGDPKAAAPLTLTCSDAQATAGNGRWISDREWAFQFAQDLPPGVHCTLQPRADFKSSKGEPLSAAVTYTFNTGGPFVQHIRPGTYQRIEEEQHFLMQLNGAATPASLQANVWCALDGLGERVPVRLIDGAARAALLASQGLEKAAAKDPLRYVALACARRFTPASKVQIVFERAWRRPAACPIGGKALCLHGARAVFGEFQLRARERAGRVPADPSDAPGLQRPGGAKAGRGDSPEVGQRELQADVRPRRCRRRRIGQWGELQRVLPEKSAFTVELPDRLPGRQRGALRPTQPASR
ncbi:MAG: hypothetical protein IPG16_06060 [Comamonadaceae bacterium]|nr:hypothetical protein [Comamonadaceae bacterium]